MQMKRLFSILIVFVFVQFIFLAIDDDQRLVLTRATSRLETINAFRLVEIYKFCFIFLDKNKDFMFLFVPIQIDCKNEANQPKQCTQISLTKYKRESYLFFRFLAAGMPLPNSDVDKLIDFETNLCKVFAGRFIPFFFTLFSAFRSGFELDLENKK